MSAAVTRNHDRFAELVARLSPQFELPVYGSAQILFGVGGLVIAAGVFFWGSVEGSTIAIAGAMVLLAGAALFLLHRLPTLGQPRVVVTVAGFRLPRAPLVSWPLVEGIWLEQIQHRPHPLTFRHQAIAHHLIFYVPTLPEWIGRLPWFMKLFFPLRTPKGKKRLRVVLHGSSEDPEVVYRLVRHLWKQSTGRDYPWFPDMMEEAAAAYRRSDENFARLIEHTRRGPEAADPAEIERLEAALMQNAAVMRDDSRRRRSRFRWIIAPALIAVVVLFLVLLGGCVQSAFYQPDRVLYDTPARHGLKFEQVVFPSKDGTRLAGWFIPASGYGDPRRARGTVVHFHGNAQNMSAHWRYVDWLVQRGFNLFVFDYRGYGASEGSPDSKGVFEDSVAALDYVRSRPDVDAARLLVFGQSLGGTNAIAAVGSGNRAGVRAVAIEATFFSYSSIASEKVIGAGSLADDSYSAERFIAALSPTPLLLMHGTADGVVPYSHSERLFAKAAEPKRLVRIEGGAHTEALTPRFGAVYQDLLTEFFAAALAAD